MFGVLGIERHADTDGHHESLGAIQHRLRQLGEQACGNLAGVLFGIGAANQHGELIAAQACHVIAAAHVLAQAFGDYLQHQVAGVVAEAIVDRLEVIEVDQHQGHAFVMPLGIGQYGGGALDQVAAVGQLGQ
ncbi:hypothetical protein D9M68_854580 [compost metagenome]